MRVENILIQVRSLLQEKGIKLWLEPYHTDGLGPCDAELEVTFIILLTFCMFSFNVKRDEHVLLDVYKCLHQSSQRASGTKYTCGCGHACHMCIDNDVADNPLVRW